MIDAYKTRIAVRAAMIICWALFIVGLLYIPQLWRTVHHEKTISVAAWPLTVDPHIVHAFEQETGIKVQIAYFERSEELFAKIKATGGRGYDMIFPSDYTVKMLIDEQVLMPLDPSRLSFWHQLDPRLLNNYYDPGNIYSIPFYWGIFGIGVNREYIPTDAPRSWALVFNQAYGKIPILMTDQAREAILAAALYLYGSVEVLKNQDARDAVKELLLQQKKWVGLYSTERLDDMLASRNCVVAFGLGTDIMRAHMHNPSIEFVVPQEGSFLIIDSIVMPRGAQEDLVYQFINYLYRPEVMQHHVHTYAMCSPLKQGDAICSDYDFSALQFLTNVIEEDDFNSIWIDLLAH